MAIDLARETALKVLYDIDENKAYSNIVLNKYLESQELSGLDKAFITDLVYGTLKWKLQIDFIIAQFSSIKLKKISPWIKNILRMGIYQLYFLDRIPASAACNESVKLAKRYGHHTSSKFANAVLRNAERGKDKIHYPDPAGDLVSYLSIRYSHPEWMVKTWLYRFGTDFTTQLLEANNDVPEFILRVNRLKVSKQQLVESLKEAGFEVADAKYVEEALTVQNPSSIMKTDLYKKGYFQVQDESSMLVAKVLDPKPGDFVMDVCSAPGGKSTHIAELMENKGAVIARDIHEHKIKLIEDAAKRLGHQIIKAEVFDAIKLDKESIGRADKVLVDAPCTGLGIIRRKPDIKWVRNENDKEEITKLQFDILSTAAKYVKPGGTLVYSTCTIEPEENQDLVKKFLDIHQEFQLQDISTCLPESLKKPDAGNGFIQLYPNIDNVDGFFISKMSKRG